MSSEGIEEHIVRCKGFTIGEKNKHLINATTMKQLLTNELESISTENMRFKPGRYGGVTLLNENKTLKQTYRKRYITYNRSFKTLPWVFLPEN